MSSASAGSRRKRFKIDGARGDLYAIGEEVEVLKMMVNRLPSRAYVSRTLFMATASIWALLGLVVLLVMR